MRTDVKIAIIYIQIIDHTFRVGHVIIYCSTEFLFSFWVLNLAMALSAIELLFRI